MSPVRLNGFTINSLKNTSSIGGEFSVMPIRNFIEEVAAASLGNIRFYALLMIKRGNGTITIDQDTNELKKGQIYFISYHQFLRFENAETCTGSAVLFTRSFYNLIYTGNRKLKNDTAFSGLPAMVQPSKNGFSVFQSTIQEIEREFASDAALKNELICLQLKVLMLKYIRKTENIGYVHFKTNFKHSYVEQFKTLVDRNFKEMKRTSAYASQLGISANYLNALIKEKLEISAETFIQQRVTLEAQRLLLNTSLSVSEISFELGFTDKSHFGKYFKKITDESPNSYRRKFQQYDDAERI